MTEDFATCRLDPSGPRRLSRVAPRFQKEGYGEAFDALTLWVDAIWHDGEVTLVCPRLNNLVPVIHEGTFTLDGDTRAKSLRSFYRHSLVRLKSPEPPRRISFATGGQVYETAVHAEDRDRFRGRNVIVTMSKDNDLVWIEDFARFHAETQGAEGIVFIDNGSTLYGKADIERTLAWAGLDALVLRTCLPFGPRGRSPYANTELYLQTCVLNAVRLRFLQHARAVLCCDIDELVLGRTATSVFDATWHSTFGLTRFGGEWRYAPPPLRPELVRHDDHALFDPVKKPSPAKWCVRPSGPLGDLQWRPHILEGFAFNWAFHSSAFTYHHCRQITTGWKRDVSLTDTSRLVRTKTARQIAQSEALAANRSSVRRVNRRAATFQRLSQLGEMSSRRFFGLRPALKVASLGLVAFMGLAAEEAIDNDPVSQEIAYLIGAFQD
ncbi:hypothetical protein LVO79_18840 (plasmid) [Roseivivax marinus]|uniref:hypothetical protein n=1 Tax=Roseivivax marinus TaxID=1379903 RepID=UPI001F035B12|nr:hypothetical protein [Roseivivax marinus]UMA67071.1 hypothetical protein LVO79_18840 [Roseivivax marinus]